jgi:hypothetical protein
MLYLSPIVWADYSSCEIRADRAQVYAGKGV